MIDSTTALAPVANLSLDPAGAERSRIEEIAARLAGGTLDAIHAFGRDLGRHTAGYADTLLAQVRAKDLDAIGGKLTEIVVAAKSLDIGGLAPQRSRVPLIGGLIDKVRRSGEAVTVRFQDVRTQIETLMGEVEAMQTGLGQRVQALDQAFESVQQEHALLGLHIEAGDLALGRLRERLLHEGAQADGDPVRAQAVQDRRDAIAALDKRVADMRMLQHAALQQLPMIRMVQANNRMLIEKFHTIRELTVPAWKRQFTLALSLNEQRSAVELANSIDDATNEFLRENARLLKDNTLSTARANQRLVIDVATLQQVHDTLVGTVQEVVRINQEGLAQRSAATAQLQGLRRQLVQQIGQGA
jgi:uncharacterized protein YaaN involved in tellurite resistance